MTRASHIDHHEMTEHSCTSRIYSTICWPSQNGQYLLLDEQYLYGDDRRVEHPLHLYVCLFGWVFILLLYPENRECIEARKPTAIKERWGGGELSSIYWSIHIDCWLPFWWWLCGRVCFLSDDSLALCFFSHMCFQFRKKYDCKKGAQSHRSPFFDYIIENRWMENRSTWCGFPKACRSFDWPQHA